MSQYIKNANIQFQWSIKNWKQRVFNIWSSEIVTLKIKLHRPVFKQLKNNYRKYHLLYIAADFENIIGWQE